MKKIVAVFDIDGTIIDFFSERIFLLFLLSKGKLFINDLFNYAVNLLQTADQGCIFATKGNKAYFKGKDSTQIEKLAHTCFRKHILHRIFARAKEKIKQHQQQQHEIVFISGTLPFLLNEYKNYFGVNKGYGTRLETKNGKFTGKTMGIYPYGEGKAEIVKKYLTGNEYDLSRSFAYGNHLSDIKSLKLFGNAFMINPNKKLAAIARAESIKIEYF
ncbi:HAD-IB family hydrolase [bacterium]|nr:HAD-IB family hydrolase [bacterium]